MSPESPEHFRIKEYMEARMREWFGASIDEYYDSGHELDVYAMTSSGVRFYIEVVWHPSLSHLKSDLLILERSQADIKVVIANPEIINNRTLVREYNKSVISQRNKGVQIWGIMINGKRILNDDKYIDVELKQILDSLYDDFFSHEAEYNFELEVNELIEKEGSIERSYEAPLIEMFIGQKSKPLNWLKPTSENAWIVSTLPGVRGATMRREYFECATSENDYVNVYTNGTFHFITPLVYNMERDLYYIDDIFYQIIINLFSSIRIMNMLHNENEHTLIVFLRNVSGITVTYDHRGWHHPYSFSDRIKEVKFIFDFLPSEDWSKYKDIMFNIYKEICTEIGSTIQDKTITQRIMNIIRTIRHALNQHTHSQYKIVIPRVTYEEFQYSDE